MAVLAAQRISIPFVRERTAGVAHGLDADQAVAGDEGVDTVLDAVAAILGAPTPAA
jgi:hypothetical protein